MFIHISSENIKTDADFLPFLNQNYYDALYYNECNENFYSHLQEVSLSILIRIQTGRYNRKSERFYEKAAICIVSILMKYR